MELMPTGTFNYGIETFTKRAAGDAQSGSGSLEQDSPLSVVAMKKEKQTGLVQNLGLGK